MASKPKGGLGRGLDVLIGASHQMNVQHAAELSDAQANNNPTGQLTMLARKQIQAGKYQPRTHMDETALNELAESMWVRGCTCLVCLPQAVVNA